MPHSDIVSINSGGPYGSSALAGVQTDSNRVWAEVRSLPKYSHWLKASLRVNACDTDPVGEDRWTVVPLDRDGLACGGPYSFSRE